MPADVKTLPMASGSGGPASTPSSVAGPPVDRPGWTLRNSEWVPCKIIQFAPLGSVPKWVVALEDGTFDWVDLQFTKHGDKPAFQPRLATNFDTGQRPHTLKLYKGKWLLARPDGRRLAEYENNEQGHRDAQAHFDRLEPELAKLNVKPE